MHELTGFQRDLLYVIAGGDEPHGLGIRDELEEYYDITVLHGRLYHNLDELDEKGLIEKRESDGRTNAYEMTSRGQRVIEARTEWEAQYITV